MEATNRVLAGQVELVPVCEKTLPNFRQHWGGTGWGTILEGSRPSKHFTQLLNELAPDGLVLTQYNSAVTRVALRWSARNVVPFLLGPHEIIRPRNVVADWWRYHRYWRIANSPQCRGVITMGNESRRLLAAGYRGPIFDIPYSFDHSRLLAMSTPSLDDGLVFLYSGRLYDFRNPLKAIRAFAKIRECNSSSKLKLVMSGEGPLLEACEQLIADLGIGESVTWMNDFEDWYAIHEIYGYADVLLALQHFGTWGIIIQEAMAAGLGIVATSSIQAADNLIINGYNGYLVSLNDEDILAAMQCYVDDAQLSKLHGQRSKEIVRCVDLPSASTRLANVVENNLLASK